MSLEALAAALDAPEPRTAGDYDRSPRGKRAAAVLLLLTDDDDPEVTLVRRAESLRSHAGQMALPGGRIDPDDDGPVGAALREAREEVGLDPDEVQVLGVLPPLFVQRSGFDVTTVVGVWDGGPLHVVDPAETASVHQVRVSQLVDAEVRRTSRHPSGHRGPAFVLPDGFVWGLTGHLLDWALELGGWTQDWDEGLEVPIPPEYLRE